jgi:hypothetical protein
VDVDQQSDIKLRNERVPGRVRLSELVGVHNLGIHAREKREEVDGGRDKKRSCEVLDRVERLGGNKT